MLVAKGLLLPLVLNCAGLLGMGLFSYTWDNGSPIGIIGVPVGLLGAVIVGLSRY